MKWCISMSFCIIGIDFDIHHAYIQSYLIKSFFLEPPRGPKTPLRGAGGPLIYKSYEMMHFNEFLYHWDRFWYTSSLYSIIFDEIIIFWAPQGPWDPLKENWGAPDTQISWYDVFHRVSVSLGSILTYNMPIFHHIWQNCHFWTPWGPLGGP